MENSVNLTTTKGKSRAMKAQILISFISFLLVMSEKCNLKVALSLFYCELAKASNEMMIFVTTIVCKMNSNKSTRSRERAYSIQKMIPLNWIFLTYRCSVIIFLASMVKSLPSLVVKSFPGKCLLYHSSFSFQCAAYSGLSSIPKCSQ